MAIADVAADQVKLTAKELSEHGYDKVTAHVVDVADGSAARALATEVGNTHGRIDVLVNNAAIYRGIDMTNTHESYLRRVLDVNLFGVWLVSQAVIPLMIRQCGGRIINQGSDAAYAHFAHQMESDELPNFSYGMSKAGVHSLTKFMASVIGKHNITVNCISPEVIMTDATKDVLSDEERMKYEARFAGDEERCGSGWQVPKKPRRPAVR